MQLPEYRGYVHKKQGLSLTIDAATPSAIAGRIEGELIRRKRRKEWLVDEVRERLGGYDKKTGYNKALRHINGDTERIPTDFLAVVASVLDVTLDWLVAERGEPKPRDPGEAEKLLHFIRLVLDGKIPPIIPMD